MAQIVNSTEPGPKHHIVFLEHFKKLKDPRQIRKSTYPLDEILLLVLCGVLSGADDWVAIELYGKQKLDYLRRFLPFKNGTPTHGQLGKIFEVIDDKQFQQCFVNWVTCLRSAIKGVVAIDGKVLRRSFDKAGKRAPSTWFRHGARGRIWCSPKLLSTRNPTRLPRFRNCSIC